MNESGGSSSEEALKVAEIYQESLRLPVPKNYWCGRPNEPPICPANILLFSRHHATELMGHPPNQHHRYILIVNLNGRGKVAVETRVHTLREGEGLLIFPFQSHCYIEVSPTAVEWLFLSFEHSSDARLDVLRDRGPWSLRGGGWDHLRHLLQGWTTRNHRDTLPLHLGLWLHEMVRTRRPKAVAGEAKVPDFHADLVKGVNQLVFAHRERSLSIEELSVSMGVSSSSLRSRFRAATGRSIGRHMREIRLNFACELLHDTRLRIEEIAGRCGYESLFAFSRAFRQAYDCSPSQYRKRRMVSD